MSWQRLAFQALIGAAILCSSATAAPPDEAAGYLKSGYAKLEAGEADPAIADFDQAIQRDSNLAIAYFYRGLARFALNASDAALTDLQAAQTLKPDWDAPSAVMQDIKAVQRAQALPVSPYSPRTPDEPSMAVGRTHECMEYFFIFSVLMVKTGEVGVRYDVTETGAITNVTVQTSSGDEWMDRAAVLCVSRRFRNVPAYRGGVAVASPQRDVVLRYETP